MENARKKELVREYRERKPSPGVFAVRCEPAGAVWTDASRNLATARNGLWFQFRSGSHANKPLLALWTTHGEAAFRFEVLEEIADDNPQLIALLLKEREAHWRKELGAGKVVG